MKNSRILVYFGLVVCFVLFAGVRTNAQSATGFTDLSYDDLTNTVIAYSETDIDYDIAGDYTAYVNLIVRDDDLNFVASGTHTDNEGLGYASVTLQFFGSPDTTYTGTGSHKLNAFFYYDYWDYDYYPYRHIYDYYDNWYFGYFSGIGIDYPWYYYFSSPGYAIRTRPTRLISLGTTHSFDSASVPGVTIEITPAQTVNDGETANFRVTVSGDTANAYQWAFTALRGAGNNPRVDFSAPTSDSTAVTSAHWFASPNEMCGAGIVATYTIKCTVTLSSGKRKTKQTELRVSAAFNGEPGSTEGVYIAGGPTYGFDTSRNLWVVVNKGTMTRSPAVAHVNIPNTSQFYDKAVAHENQHVANYNTGGVLGDLWTVDGLFSLLAPLTDSTQQGLLNKVNQTVQNWDINQKAIFASRRRADEQAAYAASDPVGPQYLGMWQCQQSRYP
jgi:hypothetical protein